MHKNFKNGNDKILFKIHDFIGEFFFQIFRKPQMSVCTMYYIYFMALVERNSKLIFPFFSQFGDIFDDFSKEENRQFWVTLKNWHKIGKKWGI